MQQSADVDQSLADLQAKPSQGNMEENGPSMMSYPSRGILGTNWSSQQANPNPTMISCFVPPAVETASAPLQTSQTLSADNQRDLLEFMDASEPSKESSCTAAADVKMIHDYIHKKFRMKTNVR